MNCMNIMKILVYTKDQSLKITITKSIELTFWFLENSIKLKSKQRHSNLNISNNMAKFYAQNNMCHLYGKAYWNYTQFVFI